MSYCASCTPPASLTIVPNSSSRCTIGKIAKILLARDLSSNYFVGPSTNPIDEEASWSGLPDAADDTLWVVSPRLESPELGEQSALEEGENEDGAPIHEGYGPTPFTAMIRNMSGAQQAALRAATCKEDLMVIFVDVNGNFFCDLRATDTHAGFAISSDTFSISDPVSTVVGGKTILKNKISFMLKEGWGENAVRVVPESTFLVLSELVPS